LGCLCNAHAAPKPATPAPTIAIFRANQSSLTLTHGLHF
jgi:hypothetical protein